MGNENREHRRAPLTGAVKFFEWNEPHEATAAEISQGGIFLKTPEAIPEGKLVTLRLSIPGMRAAFTVLGKVVRTVKGGLFAQAGMGIRFLDLAPAARRSIESYVDARGLELA